MVSPCGNHLENTMTANRITTTDRETQAGALAALEALQAIEAMAEAYHAAPDGDDILDAHLADLRARKAAVAVFLGKAGKLSDRQCGFITALAEYVDFLARVGEPDLTNWKPEAAMTAREIEKSRAETLADMLAN